MKSRYQKQQPDSTLQVKEQTELMKFLIESFPKKSRFNIKSMLKDRQVWVKGEAIAQFNHILRPNDEVVVKWTKSFEEKNFRGLKIIYEDDFLVVIDKLAGYLSIATDKDKLHNAYAVLSTHVKEQNPDNRIFVVHRLDKDTSGIMMFAKSEEIQSKLQEQWQSNTKERSYLAITESIARPSEGTITSYLGETKALIVYSSQNPAHGQLAITHFETIKTNGRHSMLKVELETGRKNQIRVHMQDLGCPLVGDEKYGARFDPIGRLGLHAWVLGFYHPITKEYLRFETDVPYKFRELMKTKFEY